MTTLSRPLNSDRTSEPWLWVLLALSVLSATYLQVLYRAVDIDGDPVLFFLVVCGAAIAGLLLGRFGEPWIAYLGGGLLAVGGALLYVSTIPSEYSISLSLGAFQTDLVALLTGLSILRIINAGVWATAVAPLPAFLTAYFAARRQYGRATLVGCLMLGFLLLTGDMGRTIGLIGVLGATAAVGFGDLARRDSDLAAADGLVIVLAVIVVLTASVSVVPGGESSPVVAGSGEGPRTIEGSLTNADRQLPVQGSIRLSPTVRFTIESERQAYWRVASYDRYTGSGWIRTAVNQQYEEPLSKPPGKTRAVQQQVRAKAPVSVMPAAWKPRSVDNRSAQVTEFGGLQPTEQLEKGDSYTVTSAVPVTSPAALRNASTDYPDSLQNRFTQLPDSTPDRVENYTSQLTQNADNSYDTARVIENHLQQKKNYSLDVRRPDDQIADSFLFDMQRGYCTYFATTMVTMLRTQGIPARMVVGYAPGEQVSANQWVVRGLDSHAWVEVYFPDHGWVRFDPTPGDSRQQAEQDVIESAREDDVDNVDTSETRPTPTTISTDNTTPDNGSPNQTPSTPQQGPNDRNLPAPAYTPSGFGNGSGTDASDDGGPSLPPWEHVLLGSVVLLGAAATARRSGASERAYRAVWLRRQPRTDPKRDIERAFDRLEHLLERNHRPRRPGETRAQYVLAVGEKSDQRVAEIYEQAVYAGQSTPELAEEAIELVDERIEPPARIDTLLRKTGLP